jgi:uncharacterized membrane protein YphA (DoxX/SURF4 family)
MRARAARAICATMMSGPLKIFLALLRVAAGLSLLGPGLTKLGWFASAQPLQQKLTAWAASAPFPFVAKYVNFMLPHAGALSKVVALGELGLGGLLLVGFLTPVAALLGFLMVLQFHFASGALFTKEYVLGQSGLVYLLMYLVLFAGRAGQALGADGLVGRAVAGGGQQAKR